MSNALRLSPLACLCVAVMLLATPAMAQTAAQPATQPADAVYAPAPNVWFNRYATQWGTLETEFFDYAEQVRPQIVQVGFWGPEYYSAIAYAKDKGADKLSAGIGAGHVSTEHRRALIRRAHEAGIKVVGHFSLTMFYGDLEENRGFFDYVDNEWDEDRLGPRIIDENGEPVRVAEMLQAGSDGPRKQNWYNVEGGDEYWADPANPHYREMLKRFVKAGIDDGLDGFMVVFPHMEYGNSPYLVNGFKRYVRENYTPERMRDELGIENLDDHKFETITGWYEPEEASPLKLAMLKYVQRLLWETKQEVFMEYGRSIKPDLMVGQWNHIYRSSMSGPGQLAGLFAQLNADEQCTLPASMWAAGENWVWYSIGNWRMYWEPKEGDFAQYSLVHKYLREAGHGKPQAVKRDDNQNIAVYIAEAVAHGGFAYARGPRYNDPDTVKTVQQYFDFLRKYEDHYRDIESVAPVALVYPRTQVHAGDTSAVVDFKQIGERLMHEHVLFDVVVDEQLTEARRATYDVVLEPKAGAQTGDEDRALVAALRHSVGALPADVIVTAWHQPQHRRVLVHLVNHTFHLPPEQLGRPADFEYSTDANIVVPLPAGARAASARLLSPEAEAPIDVDVRQRSDRAALTVNPAATYGVIVIQYEH